MTLMIREQLGHWATSSPFSRSSCVEKQCEDDNFTFAVFHKTREAMELDRISL